MNILEALLLLCLLIVISAFVSCSELALASARKIKLQVMAKDGVKFFDFCKSFSFT